MVDELTRTLSPSENEFNPDLQHAKTGKVGKVVVVKDAAYITFVPYPLSRLYLLIMAINLDGKLCFSICPQAIYHLLLCRVVIKRVVALDARMARC
jgi:hypothetical protein